MPLLWLLLASQFATVSGWFVSAAPSVEKSGVPASSLCQGAVDEVLGMF